MNGYSSDFFLQVRLGPRGPEVTGQPAGQRGHRIPHDARADGFPEGLFVEWKWDGRSLVVKNDRYGFFPVFYHSTGQQIAISNSVLGLLAAGAPAALDDAAIAAFLRLGHFLGDDTPFRGVRMLGPSSLLRWEEGALDIQTKIPRIPCTPISRRAALDSFGELLAAAIARRSAPARPLVVPLSGGRDSRHILLELCRQGIRPDECITARALPGRKYKTEVETAESVCRSVGVPLRVVGPVDTEADAETRKNRETGLLTLEHGWYLPVSDYLNERAGVIYDGMAGDVLSAGHFLTARRHELFVNGRFPELFADLQTTSDKALDSILADSVRRRFGLAGALQRFELECRRHRGAANPVSSLSIFNRTRRVASLCAVTLAGQVKFGFAPFLDNDLFDFLSSLPLEILMDGTFHTETILRSYPQHASIPFAETRAVSPAASHLRHAKFAAAVARRLAGRRSAFVRTSYVLPRLARCLCDPWYAKEALWMGTFALYLGELERTQG